MANGSIWSNRLRRLKTMDSAEIADRLRQHFLARADLVRYRFGHDFTADMQRRNDGVQGRFFFTPQKLPAICDFIKREHPAQAEEIVSRARRICDHRFDLLGYENLDYGSNVDWRLDAVHGKRAPNIPWFKIRYLDFEQVGDAKITWELNRHQHFVTLAKAYQLTGDLEFAHETLAQWEHWWKENPYPIGLNWASTLEVAFRVQSWIWTFFLLQNCPLFTAELRSKWIARLHLSGRHVEKYLSTYFSPNTHLLGEALALFFLGTLFPSPAAKKWQEQGWQILIREAGKQVREDGFYFEQSTYYHVYTLDMLLHARVLAGLNGIPIPEEFENTLQRMLDALLLLCRAGVPPMLGDDDGGRLFDPRRNRSIHMLDPLAAGAVLYQRGDYKSIVKWLPEETLWLLGTDAAEFERIPSKEPCSESTALAASGFYLMADAAPKQQLLIDAGALGAGSGGHGHADALSISLIRDGRVLLRDSGTFEYVGPGRERARLRGTGAHNTVQVDGRDQAEVTGPFSWASFPQVRVERWINGKHFDLFEGSHAGYSHRDSSIIHRRYVFHPSGNLWLVRDVVQGQGEHQVEIAWHLGSGLTPASPEHFVFSDGEERVALLPAEGQGWSGSIRTFDWSPVYGKLESAYVVSFTGSQELPAEFVTVLAAGAEAKGNSGRVAKIGHSAGDAPAAYRYLDDRRECSFVFAQDKSPWQLGSWSSDAEILFASLDRESHTRSAILCDGTYLEAGGRRILSCERRVSYAEVWSSADATDVFSSDPQAVKLERPLNQLWTDAELVVRRMT